MPELPEVEIARESLERWLVGRRIVKALVFDRRLRGNQPRRRVEEALAGARVSAVKRRGKFLLFDLDGKRAPLLSHLGMTGKFVRLGPRAELPRFVRVVLQLPRGERVALVDARRLGAFRLVGDRERRRLDALGIEPLSTELTAKRLFALVSRSARAIKIFLMDQNRLAGLGNIHATEALFLARIHPRRPASSLTVPECRRLVQGIRRAIESELVHLRTDGLDYLHEGGGALNHFLVYGRAGEPCRRCRTPIERFVQAARSSYTCPSCQPEKPRRT